MLTTTPPTPTLQWTDPAPGATRAVAPSPCTTMLLDDLRATAHWQLVEGSGDDATHRALQSAIAEIDRLRLVLLAIATASQTSPAARRLASDALAVNA